MAYSKKRLSTGKRLFFSVAITVAVFAGVYYVSQNYDNLFKRSQEDTEVGAAQADPINGTILLVQDLTQKPLEEVITDTKAVGFNHLIIMNSFAMEKNCTTGAWKVTPYYNDAKFWAVFKLAASQKQQVYVGLADLKGFCVEIIGKDSAAIIAETKKQFSRFHAELVKRGYAKQLAGVYIPQEAWVADLLAYDGYYTNIAAVIKQQQISLKVMISPYRGIQSTYNAERTQSIITKFVEKTAVDIIAPQSSVGTQYYTPSSTSEYFLMWRNAVDKSSSGIDLWANIELFDKIENNGKVSWKPATISGLVSRVDAVLPYVSSVTSFSYQYYMTQSRALTDSTSVFSQVQKYSKEGAVQRFALRSGYMMHYTLNRDLLSTKWADGVLTVIFSDRKFDGSIRTSNKVVYLTTNGAYKTVTVIKPATLVAGIQWQFTIKSSELAQVNTNAPIGIFIKTVAAKEQSLAID
jgi:hypothetical protein